MKLKIKDKVYLQRYEAIFMLEKLEYIPSYVYEELVNRYRLFQDSEDSYNFDYLFENPESVKWLMEQEWIIDYGKYAKMSSEEISSAIEDIDEEYLAKLDKFNAKSESYRAKHYEKAVEKFSKYDHALESLTELLAFLNDKLTFTFPEEYKRKKRSTFNPLKRHHSRNAQ